MPYDQSGKFMDQNDTVATPPPPPVGPSKEERQWAMFAHLSALWVAC